MLTLRRIIFTRFKYPTTKTQHVGDGTTAGRKKQAGKTPPAAAQAVRPAAARAK